MPYKSDKQRKYMNWAASEGKIKQSVVDDFNTASKGLNLPEKIHNTLSSRGHKSPDKILAAINRKLKI